MLQTTNGRNAIAYDTIWYDRRVKHGLERWVFSFI